MEPGGAEHGTGPDTLLSFEKSGRPRAPVLREGGAQPFGGVVVVWWFFSEASFGCLSAGCGSVLVGGLAVCELDSGREHLHGTLTPWGVVIISPDAYATDPEARETVSGCVGVFWVGLCSLMTARSSCRPLLVGEGV